jgi:hypothetical protein
LFVFQFSHCDGSLSLHSEVWSNRISSERVIYIFISALQRTLRIGRAEVYAVDALEYNKYNHLQ